MGLGGSHLLGSSSFSSGAQRETRFCTHASCGAAFCPATPDCLPGMRRQRPYIISMAEVRENAHKLVSQQNTSWPCFSVSFHEEFQVPGMELKQDLRVSAEYIHPQGCSMAPPATPRGYTGSHRAETEGRGVLDGVASEEEG